MGSSNHSATRRTFLQGSGAVLGGTWLALHGDVLVAAARAAQADARTGAPLANIGAAEARVLGALADQVWPPDDTPGGAELGAVYFMDFAAGGFLAGAWPMVREGALALDVRARSEHGQSFDGLAFEQQADLLREVEDTPFFGLTHFLTLLGCFCLPEYGGNRDGAGWAALGFEQRHAWQPPFGWYDEHDAEETSHAGS